MNRPLPTLRRQVLGFAIGVSGLVLFFVGAALFIQNHRQTRARLADSLRTTANMCASQISAAVAFGDAAAAKDYLGALRFNEQIVAAVIYDRRRQPFVIYGRPPFPVDRMPETVDPDSAVLVDVVYQRETYGGLLLLSDNTAELRRDAYAWITVYGLALGLASAVAWLLAARFQRAVADPIVSLARTAADVTTRRDYAARAVVRGPAEVAALAEAFNTMLAEVGRRDEELARQLLALDKEVREREAAEATLRQNTRDLLRLSREAGMAEVATGVLHNIGNALNSINVSAELLGERLQAQTHRTVSIVHKLFRDPPPRAAAVFGRDVDGADLRSFGLSVSAHAVERVEESAKELVALRTAVGHLKDIVARQQDLAKSRRHAERFDLAEAVQEAFVIDKTAGRAGSPAIAIERRGDDPPLVHADRGAVVQILINLLANARSAIVAAAPAAPSLRIVIGPATPTHLPLAVIDNGVGIPADQLVSIFAYGFTTKSAGHGFGLHNAANTARLLGGRLSVHSAGLGAGATFTLELPRHPPAPSP
jgi:C4-dicarboxylate-specific signal transduction histidine kinase